MIKEKSTTLLTTFIEKLQNADSNSLLKYIHEVYKEVDTGYEAILEDFITRHWISISECIQYKEERFGTLDEIKKDALWEAQVLLEFYENYPNSKINFNQLDDDGYRYILSYEMFEKNFPNWKIDIDTEVKSSIEKLIENYNAKDDPKTIITTFLQLLHKDEEDTPYFELSKRVSRLILFNDYSMISEINKIIT